MNTYFLDIYIIDISLSNSIFEIKKAYNANLFT